MKVLSYGPPFSIANHDAVTGYLSRRGHEVCAVAVEGPDGKTAFPLDTATDIINRFAPDWRPDLMICWCPEMAPPPLEMENCPVRTAAIVSDWSVYYPHLKHNLCRYDVALTDKLGSEVLQFPGITPRFFEPIYTQQTSVHRPLGTDRDIDIAFAGNLNHAVHVRRGKMLERVATLADHRRVVIASGVPPHEYAALLNRSKIAFNHGLRHEMNLRCFESIACGALLFIEEDNRECPDWLRDREEAVYYNEDTLLPLLEYYLDHPEECARVAAKGQSKAPALAGENRWDDFIEAIMDLPVSGRPFSQQSERDRMLADAFQYASSAHPEHEAFARQRLEEALSMAPEYPENLMAMACFEVDTLSQQSEAQRREQTARLLSRLQQAAQIAPQETPVWLNLAFVCRHAGNSIAEARFLELALETASDTLGHLTLGERRDPYTSRYREALAFGTARPDTLRAFAASRLAELRLAAGDTTASLDWAKKSIAWEPEVATPYRTAARALLAEGHGDKALAIARQGIPFIALDSDYRRTLFEAMRTAGEHEAARELARETMHIFSAWQGADHVVRDFEEMLRHP